MGQDRPKKTSRNGSVPGKNNFASALNEMLGLNLEKEEFIEESTAKDENAASDFHTGGIKSNLHMLNAQNPDGSLKKSSIIAEGTVIEGEIRTTDNMSINGIIKGSISSDADMFLEGRVYGNITCKSAMIKNGLVEGNINAQGDVTMVGDAMVLGDIEADTFASEGKVKGNIKAGTSAVLNNNAVLAGNIHTKSISVTPGVIINGQVKVLGDTPIEDLFRAQPVKAAPAAPRVNEDIEPLED